MTGLSYKNTTAAKDSELINKARLFNGLLIFGIISCAFVSLIPMNLAKAFGISDVHTLVTYFGLPLTILGIVARQFAGETRPFARFAFSGFAYLMILTTCMNIVVLLAANGAVSRR